MRRLSRSTVLLLACLLIAASAIGGVLYALEHPRRVEIRYGTMTVNEAGQVISDETATAWVTPEEAREYHLEVKTVPGGEGPLPQTNQPLELPPDMNETIRLMWEHLARYSDDPSLVPLEPEPVQALITMLEEYRASMEGDIEALEAIEPGEISEQVRASSLEAYGMIVAAIDLYIQGLQTGEAVYFRQAETMEAQVYMIFR